MADFISKSFVHAKRRQYECMASDAGKLHGRYRNGMGTALISACHALISVFGRDPGLVFSWQLRGSNGTKWNSPSTYGVLQVTDCRVILANRFPLIANERTAATQARRRHLPPGLPAGCQASAIGACATLSALSVPKAIGLGLRLRLPDDGQRHLRCCAKGGDAAIGQSVGIVLAAVLDLKVQPRAPAFAGHLAAVGFAGQVHPGAGAVLDPEAVDAERRVYVQAEALGAAAFGQRYLE